MTQCYYLRDPVYRSGDDSMNLQDVFLILLVQEKFGTTCAVVVCMPMAAIIA